MAARLTELDRGGSWYVRAVSLPDGVRVIDLPAFRDARGTVVETFRPDWLPDFASSQWTLLHSDARVVRGVHCHLRRTDYVVAALGTVHVVLVDARPSSATFRAAERVVLESEAPQALLVPVGVGHAFETVRAATVLTGLDTTWDPADEFGCSWTDPVVRHLFTVEDPLLSERDARAGNFDDMVAALAAPT